MQHGGMNEKILSILPFLSLDVGLARVSSAPSPRDNHPSSPGVTMLFIGSSVTIVPWVSQLLSQYNGMISNSTRAKGVLSPGTHIGTTFLLVPALCLLDPYLFREDSRQNGRPNDQPRATTQDTTGEEFNHMTDENSWASSFNTSPRDNGRCRSPFLPRTDHATCHSSTYLGSVHE